MAAGPAGYAVEPALGSPRSPAGGWFTDVGVGAWLRLRLWGLSWLVVRCRAAGGEPVCWDGHVGGDVSHGDGTLTLCVGPASSLGALVLGSRGKPVCVGTRRRSPGRPGPRRRRTGIRRARRESRSGDRPGTL